jgi:Bacterial SH3 domain
LLEPIVTGDGANAGLIRLRSTRPLWLTGGAVLCALGTWAIFTTPDTRERALESTQVAPVQSSGQSPQLANPELSSSSPFLSSQPPQRQVGVSAQAALEREQAGPSTSGDGGSQPGEVELPASTSLQADRLEPINPAAGAHAIVPEPALSEALAVEEQASSPSISRERVRVASAATIHSGPSTSDILLGTAQVGAEAEVASRDADWVQIIDPASGKVGWINSKHLMPAPAVGVQSPSQLPSGEQQAALGGEQETVPLPPSQRSLKSKKKSSKYWRKKRRGLALRLFRRFR